jgi:diguanylate cyclase (GGDEF)-like protein
MTKPDIGSRPALRLFSMVVGVITAIAGIAVLSGWVLDVPVLKSVLPGFATMKANTSIGVAMLGVALCLMQYGDTARRMGKMVAAAVLIVGIVTLLEYMLGWDAGIDQLLFKDQQALANDYPGRPSHATAFNLIILSIGLLCVDSRAFRCLTTAMALIASLVSWVALNGYVFGAQALYGIGLYSSIAVHTAAIFFLFGLGLFATQPQCSPTKLVLSKSTGGTLSRWLLPFAVLAPPVLGWFFRHVQTLGVYHDEFSWALYSVASSVGSVGLIILLAHRIITIDAERAKATELSRHDSLTGLPNRRAFDEYLLENFRLARRHSRPLSLLMVDVDHFKQYNDTFGHPAGDEALVITAGLLSKHARETDLVSRVGGEEFAIVLPETDIAGAQLLAERIREEVERSALYRRPMTVSIGAASLTAEVEDTALLIEQCDVALYRAKQQGRNRVSGIEEPAAEVKQEINYQV